MVRLDDLFPGELVSLAAAHAAVVPAKDDSKRAQCEHVLVEQRLSRG